MPNDTPARSGLRPALPKLEDFVHLREDRIRLSDLDFQKHVNNAALTGLLANARFEFLGETVRPWLPEGSRLVLATLEVRFVQEVAYGHAVFTGTRVMSLGNSSIRLEQVIYQSTRCALHALTVLVHSAAGRPGGSVWPDELRGRLS